MTPGSRPPDAVDVYAIRCLRIDCRRSLFVADTPEEAVAAYLDHPCVTTKGSNP